MPELPASPLHEPAPKTRAEKYTREQVVQAFTESFDSFSTSPGLNPEQQLALGIIQGAKERTLDKGKTTTANRFSNSETGQEFVTQEGIPVDKLIAFLSERIDSGKLSEAEKAQYEKNRGILALHSQKFLRGSRTEPGLHFARIQQEAYLISQDPRNVAGEVGDWYKAKSELESRRELVLPPKIKKTVKPPEPPEVPEPLPPVPPIEIPPPPIPPDNPPPEPPEVPEPLPPVPPIEIPPPPIPPDNPPPVPPTVADVRYEVAIVNRTIDISKRAREIAEEHLREKLKGRNIFRRIKYRIAEEYYRQKFTEQAYKSMVENGNSYLTMKAVKSHLEVANAQQGNGQERDAGRAKIAELRLREEMGQHTLHIADGALKQQLLETIIKPVATGEVTQPDQVRRLLTAFMTSNQTNPLIQELFGQDERQIAKNAEYFATDLLDMGQRLSADYTAHGKSMEWLDQHVEIQLANTQWAASTERQKLSRTDRFIKWAQNGRVRGAIFNPAVVGAMSSIGTFAFLRAPMKALSISANIGAPGAGMLTGGLFAAFRRNYDLKVDRAAHQVERAYNMQIPEGAKRREKLERFSYATVSVQDLLNGGGVDRQRNDQPRRSLREMSTSDLSNESNRLDLISRVAEIEQRLDYSTAHKVDLITFGSRESVEQGRLQLLQAVVEGRRALRDAGIDPTRIELAKAALTTHFEKNQSEKDKAFKTYRLKSSLANGAFGSAAGLVSGLVVQEGVALGMRASGHGVGQTVLEKTFGFDGSKPRSNTNSIDVFRDLAGRGGSYDVSSDLRFNINSSAHTAQIIDISTGQSLTNTPIRIGQDGHMVFDGKMPPDLQDKLQDAHFNILDTSTPSQDITKTIPGKDVPKIVEIPGQPTYVTEIVHGPQSVEQWNKVSTHIDQQQWYGYNTPKSELNELRAYTIKDGNTLILDMSRMKMGSQTGLVPNPIDVQNVINNGEGGFSFRLPGMANQTVWIPESADGVQDGLLHLNPMDTTHFVRMGDGSQMSIGDLSKMIVNPDELAKLKDGDIATELFHHREVFQLGMDGKKGYWEVGRMVDHDGKKVLQTFATGRGTSDAVGLKITEIPGTPTTKTVVDHIPGRTFVETIPGSPQSEIIPPTYTEFSVNPVDTIPLIPIPFAPRHPLERLLFTYGYGGEYTRGELGLIPMDKYVDRLSESLKNNSDADLDEDVEVTRYMESMSPAYKNELSVMNNNAGFGMSGTTRVVITVPAYGEEQNIEKLLNQFSGQVGNDGKAIDFNLFEVLVFENHPDTVSKDRTEELVRNFQKTHPELKIVYAHKAMKKTEAGVGRARKYAADLAVLRSQQRSGKDGELILVSQDADLEKISPTYVSELVQSFDDSPEVDALAGKWNLPDEVLERPNMRAAQRLWYIMDRVISRDAVGKPDERQLRAPGLVGRNAAFRASIYSAIGGYNPEAKLAEDLEIGWMINAARNWDPLRIQYNNRLEVVSNPRRFLASMAQGIPLIQMYGGFHENTDIRQQDNSQLLSIIPKTFRVASFEREADAIWRSHIDGQYVFMGDSFNGLFDRAMTFLGVKYTIENGHVKILDATKLTKSLNVKASPSTP